MEAVCSSETLVRMYHITRYPNTKDRVMKPLRCERTPGVIKEGSCSASVAHFIHFCHFLLKGNEHVGPEGIKPIVDTLSAEFHRMILIYCRGSRGV
jgi:hypothetical protein